MKADYGRGFLTQGLFAYSRHPNFFAEQSMWWAFYLFAVAAKGGLDAGRDAWLQPVLVGPVLLSLLFQGSTPFTEDITVSKYPGAFPLAVTRRSQTCSVLRWFGAWSGGRSHFLSITDAAGWHARAAYAEYQKKVSRLIPLPPSGRMK